jgi:DNA repair exonuclease SbcCD ATPase subunit
MITFKLLSWGNAFSYGKDNSIDLSASPLTQLLGKNGHGKSSVALVLEEVLFNTNSKKIKKADVLNRYTKDKNYWIELEFEKDGNSYSVRTVRTASSGTVVLTCNGEDISSHTATGTYKSIENILGYDHKTFSQIVYQSSVSSLEFLTATDTARKKFLIDLLNLSNYTRACDTFKEIATSTSKQLDIVQAKADTLKSWIDKNSKIDRTIKELVEEPVQPTKLIREVESLKIELSNAEATNKKISQNNTYGNILSTLVVDSWSKPVPSKDSRTALQTELITLQQELKRGDLQSKQCSSATSNCPTCGSSVDHSKEYSFVTEFKARKPSLLLEIADYEAKIKAYDSEDKAYTTYLAKIAELEKYTSLYSTELPSVLVDKDALTESINSIGTELTAINSRITKARAHNKLAEEHNAKVTVVEGQLVEMAAELTEVNKEIATLAMELADIQVLVKAFSTTGLVAYKIECLVKDLESITNEYLGVLAGGRFQLGFKVNSSDKLNVVITDNGRDISIDALSGGERARVNVATLLAIRKLMQALSNSRTNLLILDETVEALDAEGKEKLVEILLAEENLNTFLISHGFSHPLLEKVQVVKENNISRIE